MSDSLRPHESQHARPPWPSPTPGVHSHSRPLSWWCQPAISSCRPLLLLPPIPPSIRVFSNESTLRMRWPKYWSFSFSITPSKEIPRLVLINLIYWFSSSFEKVLLHYFPETWLSQLNLSPSLIIQVFTACIFISQIHQAHSYLHITLLLLLS